MLRRIVGSFSREFHPFHRETGKLIDRLFASIFLSPPLLTLFVLREDNFVERPAPVSATTYERFKLVSFVFRTLSNRRVKYEAKERGKVFIRPFRGKQTNLPSLPAGQNDEKKANELGQRVRDSSSDESR